VSPSYPPHFEKTAKKFNRLSPEVTSLQASIVLRLVIICNIHLAVDANGATAIRKQWL
jgi:hypothetical protein